MSDYAAFTGEAGGVVTAPTPLLLQGDARALPLPDESVDLVVTSPPYWSLRDYGHSDQIGSEPTWQEYINNLLDCTREWVRVLKPSGSLFVNLGDKYSTGNSGQSGLEELGKQYRGGGHTDAKAKQRSSRVAGMPAKCLLDLPWRYGIRCVDDLGLIKRAEIIWAKKNGLPESVVDRVRRSHEVFLHLTKSPRYFAAVDEIREPHAGRHGGGRSLSAVAAAECIEGRAKQTGLSETPGHPLGKLPGSVWEVATQPLNVPEHVSHKRCCGGKPRDGCVDGLDHYAAMPMAWPLRIIPGWCPREVCTACGEGRRPVAEKGALVPHQPSHARGYRMPRANPDSKHGTGAGSSLGFTRQYTITGYACDCPDATAPSRPGVVLDPFGGTGTTALVAAMLGYTGISVDLSLDYSRDLAAWRASDPKERARAAGLDPDAVAKVHHQLPGQGSLLDLFDGEAVS